VLLDNFVAASARLEAKEAEQQIAHKKALRQFKNPLEPLVARCGIMRKLQQHGDD
jgi:hypothetical protein